MAGHFGLNIAIFIGAVACVWFAGVALTTFADVIAERTNLGRALIGVLLLGLATSLPEIATTATASASGNAALAGNKGRTAWP